MKLAILARCCFENSFWVEGLIRKGDEFAQKMLHDEIKSREARGQALFDGKTTRSGLDEETERKLGEWLSEHRKLYPNAKYLNPKEVAKEAPGGDAYVLYSELFGRLRTSVSQRAELICQEAWRYFICRLRGLKVAPPPHEEEIELTLGYACLALLGTCYGVRQFASRATTPLERRPPIVFYIQLAQEASPTTVLARCFRSPWRNQVSGHRDRRRARSRARLHGRRRSLPHHIRATRAAGRKTPISRSSRGTSAQRARLTGLGSTG